MPSVESFYTIEQEGEFIILSRKLRVTPWLQRIVLFFISDNLTICSYLINSPQTFNQYFAIGYYTVQ